MKIYRIGATVFSITLALSGSLMVLTSPTSAAPVMTPPTVRVCAPTPTPPKPLPALPKMMGYTYADPGMLFLTPDNVRTLCGLLTGQVRATLVGGKAHVGFRQCGYLGVTGQPVPLQAAFCMYTNFVKARALHVLMDDNPAALATLSAMMNGYTVSQPTPDVHNVEFNVVQLATMVRDLMSNQIIQIVAPPGAPPIAIVITIPTL